MKVNIWKFIYYAMIYENLYIMRWSFTYFIHPLELLAGLIIDVSFSMFTTSWKNINNVTMAEHYIFSVTRLVVADMYINQTRHDWTFRNKTRGWGWPVLFFFLKRIVFIENFTVQCGIYIRTVICLLVPIRSQNIVGFTDPQLQSFWWFFRLPTW